MTRESMREARGGTTLYDYCTIYALACCWTVGWCFADCSHLIEFTSASGFGMNVWMSCILIDSKKRVSFDMTRKERDYVPRPCLYYAAYCAALSDAGKPLRDGDLPVASPSLTPQRRMLFDTSQSSRSHFFPHLTSYISHLSPRSHKTLHPTSSNHVPQPQSPTQPPSFFNPYYPPEQPTFPKPTS